ncbi:MAG: TIGR01777 family oxidoreductase [Verrucomicrobia bacterium]|nr:TIGR01777 family oxidoreductase [Verrucomicrobiota bacterium]
MKILITGATGLIGNALSSFLEQKGAVIGKVVRKKTGKAGEVLWNLETGEGDIKLFEGWDVVIHLAGESLSKGFWTQEKKRKIKESRAAGTSNLVKILDDCKNPPKIFISASAVGYYGNYEGEITEESSPGEGFLSEVCLEWEKAAKSLKNPKTRVVIARFGYVLSTKGGLLKIMKSLFLLGLGGKMGTGKQFMPWVAIDDLVRALYHIIEKEEIRGPVNIVSPEPVRQEVFAKTLAKVLHRPCFFSIPKFLLVGSKAKALILPSLEVYPLKLLKTGFVFTFPNISIALRKMLR